MSVEQSDTALCSPLFTDLICSGISEPLYNNYSVSIASVEVRLALFWLFQEKPESIHRCTLPLLMPAKMLLLLLGKLGFHCNI